MSVVLSIDAGTTGVRTFAVNQQGATVAMAYREFTQHFPKPGWVEHDPEEIWQAVLATLAEVMHKLDETVSTIGITNQRETVVVWDKRNGSPLHNAIVWQDRRTASRCEELKEQGHLEMVRIATGLVLDPYFSASKLEWLFRYGGITPTRTLAVGTIDSWLIYKLSGGSHVTDTSNASRTMLFDTNKMAWSEELCSLFGVPVSGLGEVVPSSGHLAETTSDIPTGAGVSISGVAGDQQAALFGHKCFAVGQAKNTYGTGSFLLLHVGLSRPEPIDGLLSTVAWTYGDKTTYAYEGSIFITGAAIQWLRDGIAIISDVAETEKLATSVNDSGGVMFVPALVGLGSPHWDAQARGTIIGITRGTGRGEIARATVEAIAFQTRDVVAAMTNAAVTEITQLRVDGGASVMDFLMQLQADQLGVPVIRTPIAETTALGAAYLAGLAKGVWADLDEVASLNDRGEQTFQPNLDRSKAEASYIQWQRALDRSRAWASC